MTGARRVAAAVALAIFLAGAAVAAGWAGWGHGWWQGWQSALAPQGPQAASLLRLIGTFVAVCSVVWVLVLAVLLRSLWRGRRSAAAGTALDAATERRMKWTISLAVSATVLVVIALTAVSFFATRHITQDDPNALLIRVRGWQWWWEVTYPDAGSPARTVVSANEIHVPVGRAVRIELSAADVIHSFWVPNLAGKQDLIPGRDNTLTFTAARPGVYRGQCAEFCGLQHAHMAFVVVAHEPAAFEAWRAAQLADAVVPRQAELAAGRQVFMAKGCAGCHAVRGTPAAGSLGPDLTHVGSRRTIAAGLFETTRGSLAAWIADPQTLKPGNNMPRVDLSADELNAVAAWLESLR